jgi:basic membrane protein A
MRRTRVTSAAVIVAATSLAIGGVVSAQSPDASGAPAGSSDLKIGFVTDVGSLNDRNFNQYSWEGTLDGAARIGAAEPQSAVSTTSAEIATNIQGFVDKDYDIIVTVGFAAGNDTAKAAKANPDIMFIGVDQNFVCLDANGDIDTTPAGAPDCEGAGDSGKLLPNRVGIGWHEEQPGYLAGVVAASISKTKEIAAIGGTASVPAVPNYIVGYGNGARSVDPNVQVHTVYLSPAPDAKAFNDPAEGNLQTTQLMSLYPNIDVVFQVAGKSGNGALQAACDAGIYGIGVDVDQFVSTPEYDKCIVVSAEKKLKKNVSDMIAAAAAGQLPAGGIKLDITTDDVGLSPFHDFQSLVTPELQAALDAATAGLKDGSLQACELTPFASCVVPAQ